MAYHIEKKAVDAFSSLDLFAKQVVEGFITGLHKSPFHGFSVEFAEHRLYNSGESVRNIDWKVYGRTDKLFVKKYEEETNLRCQLIIDNSSSMYFPEQKTLSLKTPNKMFFAVHAAAVLLHILKKQRDAFGLTLFSEALELHTRAKSTGVHHSYLLYELQKLLKQPDYNTMKKTSLSDVLHNVADALHKRSLLIIFSDMLDSSARLNEVLQALQHMKHNKHEVILFHVYDKSKEMDFEFENRPHKFIDIENKEEIKLNPKEVKAAFVKASADFRKELYLKCADYKVELVEADINNGFEQILFPFFVKRQKLN